MLSFRQFITEAPKFQIEKFKRDCAFVLEHLDGHDNLLLWRGDRAAPADWEIRTWSERKEAVDTPRTIHTAINDYSRQRFGAPIRNWRFCTGFWGDASIYSGYGNPVTAIFPIGKFEWVCSKNEQLRDLTGFIRRVEESLVRADPGISAAELEEKTTGVVLQQFDRSQFWQNTDLVSCLESENEIMWKCNRYYCFTQGKDTFHSEEMQDLLKSIS
jgi:hypothetical protein